MDSSRLSASMLERLERIRMREHDRAEARAHAVKAAELVEKVFGFFEAVGSRGRRLKRQISIARRQAKRRLAHA